MTLRELKGYGNALDIGLQYELKNWRSHSHWWKTGSTPTQQEMIRWCRAFIRFYIAVRIKGQDIEPAFQEWVGSDAPFQDMETNQMSVPQLSVWDKYRAAVFRMQQSDKMYEDEMRQLKAEYPTYRSTQ